MASRNKETLEGDSDKVIENIGLVADKLSEQVSELQKFVTQLKQGRPGYSDENPLRSIG